MSFLEACTIPLALCTAAFGFCVPNPPLELQLTTAVPKGLEKVFPHGEQNGGAGRTAFWEDNAENSAAGEAIVILGGSSSVGQFS